MKVPAANHRAALLPSAHLIGNAFVTEYYNLLCNSPESVYKFYNDSSILSRPNSDGMMTSVTTLKAIDEKIQSLDSKNSKPEIKTVDGQESYQKGLIVVATGSLTGTNDVKRKFSQTFFLAPQEKGYFVLNDVFRYVKESRQLEINSTPVNCDSDSVQWLPWHQFQSEDSGAVESEGESQDRTMTVINLDSFRAQQENKSYTSIVKVPKADASPASNFRWSPTTTSPIIFGSINLSPGPTASPLSSDYGPESSNPQEVEGHSIYIHNLPLSATVARVTKEFTKFGPIKHGGVQVNIHKQNRYRYGFVEFQSLESMQNAIKASPFKIGGHHVQVAKKKSTIRVGMSENTERFTTGRGKFQRGRGRGYFDGMGYGRSDFRSNNDFSSRPKSNSGHNTEYRYQPVERSGSIKRGSQAGVDKCGL